MEFNWNLFWIASGVIFSMFAFVVTIIVNGFGNIRNDIKSLGNDLKQIDQRLSKLEGGFEERGRWESRKIQ